MSIREEAGAVLSKVVKMTRLVCQLERLLLEDQADAIANSSHTSMAGGGTGSDVSDPTPNISARLAPYAGWNKEATAAIRGIDKAINNAEAVVARIISQSGGKTPPPATETCAGWTEALRKQLGGCGKPMEYYRLASGEEVTRSSRLCSSCRKAKERAEAEQREAA